MSHQDEMPFGRFKGEKMEKVPASYLLWLRDQGCANPGVAAYIEDNLVALAKECPDHIIE
jgi:uncharacterized protein (DUF3820 family)